MSLYHPMATLAVTDIPCTGQRMLAQRGSREIRAALAASPLTTNSVIEYLVTDTDPGVRKFAFARTQDTKLLESVLDTRPGHTQTIAAPHAARNTLVEPDTLIKSLRATHRGLALAAWCNPSTPEEARRTLTPERASELCRVGGSNHDHVVRSYELVANNRWMLEDATRWPGEIRRAFSGLPEASADVFAALRKVGRQGVTTAKRHPALCSDLSTRPLSSWTLDELVRWGSPATDLYALEHPLLGLGDITGLLSGVPEPHVIGRLINRFGAANVLGTLQDQVRSIGNRFPDHPIQSWSGTRIKAATWVAPVLGYVQPNANGYQDAHQAAAMLGEDAQAWDTFLSLLPDWHDTYVNAASSAIAL